MWRRVTLIDKPLFARRTTTAPRFFFGYFFFGYCNTTAHWGNPISSFLVFIGFSSTDHHHPSLLEFSVGVTVDKQRYGPAQTTDFSTDGSHLLYIFCGMSICPLSVHDLLHLHRPPQLSQLLFHTGGAIHKPLSSSSRHRQKYFYFLARQNHKIACSRVNFFAKINK